MRQNNAVLLDIYPRFRIGGDRLAERRDELRLPGPKVFVGTAELLVQIAPANRRATTMREWMGRMGISAGGETAATLREQARRIATCSMRFSWDTTEKTGGEPSTLVSNERIIKSGLFFTQARRP